MYPDTASQKSGGHLTENSTHRTRAQSFVMSHLRAWELTFAVLAIISVVIGLTAGEGTEADSWVGLEWGLTGVFAVEYVFRVWAAPARWQLMCVL